MNLPTRPRALELHGETHGSSMMVGSAISKPDHFGIGEALGEGRVVIDPADAIALLQRDLRLGLAFECHDVGAVFFGHRLVVPRALNAAISGP